MAEKNLYTARAKVEGGRTGRGTSDDGELDVDLRRPKDLGGEGGGTNPEQLYAVGHASCFLGALDVAARRARASLEGASIDCEVELRKDDEGRYGIAVRLDARLPDVEDQSLAAELVEKAETMCAYSNATRGNVPFELSVNGEALRT